MSQEQLIIGGTVYYQLPTTAGTGYHSLSSGPLGSVNEYLTQLVFPCNGVLSNLHVKLPQSAPGSDNSHTFTVRKTGVEDTDLSCTIADENTYAADDTHTVEVTAGEQYSLKRVTVGTPTASTATWSLKFTPANANQSVILGTTGLGSLSNSVDNFVGLAAPSLSATEVDVQVIIPVDCTVKALYVNLNGAPGFGKSWTYMLRKDTGAGPADTALTFSIADDATEGHLITDVSVNAGDLLNVKVSPVNSPLSVQTRVSILIETGSGNQFVLCMSSFTATSNGNDRYGPVCGCWGNGLIWNTDITRTEQLIGADCLAKAIYTLINPATGNPAKTYTHKFKFGGVDSSDLVTVISGSATTGNAAGNDEVAADTLVALHQYVTATSTAATTRISLLMEMAGGVHIISGAGNIGSGEVHGTLKIILFILAAALASAEAAGSPWVNQSLSAASISSEEAPGSPTVLLGPMTVLPAAIASAETFGLAKLNQTLAAVAISSAEALGGPRLNLGLSPPGIASGEACGAATVLPGAVTVSPAGVPSAEAPGAPQINRTLLALGLDSAEAWGNPQVRESQVVQPGGGASGEGWGTPALSTQSYLLPPGLDTAESFGAPVLLPGGLTLKPSGIPGGEVLGSPQVYSGSVLLPEGITAGETLGLPLVQPGTVALWPSGLGTQEALGFPVIFPPIPESLRIEATLREAEVPVSLSPAPQTGVFLCQANVEVHLDG